MRKKRSSQAASSNFAATSLFLLVCCLCLAGCVIPVPLPGNQTVSPHLRGRVVDSVTQQPIAGAKAMIYGRPETAVQTDDTGSFRIRRVRQFYLIHFASRGVEWNFPHTSRYCSKVDISHPDYEGAEFEAWEEKRVATKPGNSSAPLVLKDVLLVPKSK